MNIFKNIFTANTEITNLNKIIGEWVGKGADYDKQINDLQDTIGKFMEEKAGFEKQIADVKAEYELKISDLSKQKDTEINNLETVVKETAESTSDQALDLVASLGVEPNTVKVTNTEVNPQDIYNTWMNLCKNSPKDAQVFYGKNKDTLNKITGYKA